MTTTPFVRDLVEHGLGRISYIDRRGARITRVAPQALLPDEVTQIRAYFTLRHWPEQRIQEELRAASYFEWRGHEFAAAVSGDPWPRMLRELQRSHERGLQDQAAGGQK